jgi:hypothetical protein
MLHRLHMTVSRHRMSRHAMTTATSIARLITLLLITVMNIPGLIVQPPIIAAMIIMGQTMPRPIIEAMIIEGREARPRSAPRRNIQHRRIQRSLRTRHQSVQPLNTRLMKMLALSRRGRSGTRSRRTGSYVDTLAMGDSIAGPCRFEHAVRHRRPADDPATSILTPLTGLPVVRSPPGGRR